MSRGDATVSCFDSRFEAGGFLRSLERVDIACEPTQPECLALVARTADVVVVEATAVSPLRVLSPVGSHVVAAVAASVGTPVWLVAGVGRRLPPEYVDVIAALTDADGSGVDEPSVEELPLRLVDLVVTEDGTCPPDRIESACPLVPGLTRIGRR